MSETNKPVYFYAAPLSLFSGKVRAYLVQSGIAFEERLPAHPVMQKEIVPTVGRQVLPCLSLADGTILQDTSEIIDTLAANGLGHAPLPSDARMAALSLLLEMFGDEGLLRAAMHYRWNYRAENDPFLTFSFARAAVPSISVEQAESVAGPAMQYFSSLLPGLGVCDSSVPAIEAGYEAALDVLEEHFKHHPFLCGDSPTVADYGFFGPLYAHLGRDIYPANIMKNRSPRTYEWLERMMAPNQPRAASSLSFEDGSESLLPLLKLVAADFYADLKAVHAKASSLIAESGADLAGQALPRTFGDAEIDIRGHKMPLKLRPYMLWMQERFLAAFNALSDTEKDDVRSLLDRAGLGGITDMQLPLKLERRDYKEVWCARA